MVENGSQLNQIERIIQLVFEEMSFQKEDLELPAIQQLHEVYLEECDEMEFQPASRKVKEVTECIHKDRRHYAKGMCSNCYHRFGREKLAYACQHVDRQLYAKGKCQFCYLKTYYRNKNKRY